MNAKIVDISCAFTVVDYHFQVVRDVGKAIDAPIAQVIKR